MFCPSLTGQKGARLITCSPVPAVTSTLICSGQIHTSTCTSAHPLPTSHPPHACYPKVRVSTLFSLVNLFQHAKRESLQAAQMTHFSSLESQYSYSECCKHFCRPLGYQNIWQLLFSDWNWNLLTHAIKEVLLKTPAYEEAVPVDPIILETATSAEARKHLKHQELTWEGFRTVWPPRRVFILPLGPTTSIHSPAPCHLSWQLRAHGCHGVVQH